MRERGQHLAAVADDDDQTVLRRDIPDNLTISAQSSGTANTDNADGGALRAEAAPRV
jgi:hypothetical protein